MSLWVTLGQASTRSSTSPLTNVEGLKVATSLLWSPLSSPFLLLHLSLPLLPLLSLSALVMEQLTSIISWNIANINGLCGDKSNDTDFLRIVKKHRIICFQETGQEVNIPGYHSFSDLRCKGKNGGVTTLVSNSIANSCTHIESRADSATQCSMNLVIVRFTLEKGHGPNHSRFMFIVNVYIPPANSIRKAGDTNSATNFSILQSTINQLVEEGEVIVCGDFNARIGICNDINVDDNLSDFVDLPHTTTNRDPITIPLSSPISTNRNSQDVIINSHKNHLLDLVQINNLLILNGRCIGDSVGKYTCFKWNGNSVVDYFMCTNGVIPSVKSLSVREHTLYSDHNPVVLSLWNTEYTPSPSPTVSASNTTETAPFRNKITPETLSSFKEAQKVPSILAMIHTLSDEADGCTTRNDASQINDKITNLINNLASDTLERSKPPSNNSINPKHNAWFDHDCRTAKRGLNRSVRLLNKHPNNYNLKMRHRANVKSYRKIIISKKDKFFNSLNNKVKNGKMISWKDFKKLKKFKKSEVNIDDSNFSSFQSFYQRLYSDDHTTIDGLTKAALVSEALETVGNSPVNDTLNSPFSSDELDHAIRGLKNGKASSFDHISNEIIKAMDNQLKDLVLKLFNICLRTGSYFWGRSILTPIHKKGNLLNPDNYRGIAVCSCLGKLLSTMLLQRLISHRAQSSPDPPNQCGFTKGKQCDDHIFTLHTILEKYKLYKKKVFVAFIDLRKAFDLVCRQALLYKLACYGINGGFFHLINDMYSNSSGHLKLNGKISSAFPINKGTEQGHPLSPELFKVYFKELSDFLNNANTNNPVLSGHRITHLAWADDLVLLSLDRNSLNKQLSIVENYCRKWGLEINTDKTKYMIFNSRDIASDVPPTLSNSRLERVSTYCYLGIIISSNGKFRPAIQSLSTKGLGALFSLQRTLDRRFVDPKCLDQLFDSLVSPILTYGCQTWLPVSPFISSLTKGYSRLSNDGNLLNLFAKQPYEKVQLRHLKYLLGLNRRASNAASWGETGKFPITIGCIPRCIRYFIRLVNLDDSSIVSAAMREQISLSLPWFEAIKNIIVKFDSTNPSDYDRSTSPLTNALCMADLCSPDNICSNLKDVFIASWNTSISNSTKLDFYRKVKDQFIWEPYLGAKISSQHRFSTTRIRCSAHKLNIELGRYNGIAREDRTCDFCRLERSQSFIEDEDHLLNICPIGDSTRAYHNRHILSLLSADDIADFNIAATYPSNFHDANPNQDIIKLCCQTIHNIYSSIIGYKDNINQ